MPFADASGFAAFTDALTTFLGGVGGTIVILMPGYVLAQTYKRGVPGPSLGDYAFVATTAIGGLVTHAIALPFTVWLVQLLTPSWPSSLLAHYGFVALWLLVVLIVIPAVLGTILAALLVTQVPRPIHLLLDGLGLTRAIRAPTPGPGLSPGWPPIARDDGCVSA